MWAPSCERGFGVFTLAETAGFRPTPTPFFGVIAVYEHQGDVQQDLLSSIQIRRRYTSSLGGGDNGSAAERGRCGLMVIHAEEGDRDIRWPSVIELIEHMSRAILAWKSPLCPLRWIFCNCGISS